MNAEADQTADGGCPPHCCCCGPGEPCCDCGQVMPAPDLQSSRWLIADLWQDQLDKDDRTSPEDYPDMALITAEEFEAALICFGRDVQNRSRSEIINTPETADFMAGVPIEAAHQRERWGVSHDAGKTPFDWFWLIGYLAQKAASSAVAGDIDKALHHTISTAAALANWHAALTGADTSMRPGIKPPLDLDNLPLAQMLNRPFPTPSAPKGSDR